MRKTLLYVVAAAVALCAGIAVSATPQVKAGDVAKPFTLENMEGDDVTVEFGKGKATLISLWVSTCQICREEFPFLEELKERYGAKLDIVMVNCDMMGARGVLKALKQMKRSREEITFPILLDPGLKVARDVFGFSTYPVFIFVDKEGKVDKVIPGFDADLKELAAITAKRLAQ